MEARVKSAASRGRSVAIAICVLTAVLLAACGGAEGPAAQEANPLEAQLTQEATAAPAAAQADDGGTQPSPTPNSALETAVAEATEAAIGLEMTRVSAEQTRVFDELREDESLLPITAELAGLGINPNQGALGFTHPPITLEVNDPEELDFANRNALTVAQDFVMAADISWQTAASDVGCGFAMRSDGDEEAPSNYIISLTPNQGGHALFAEQVAGEIDLSDSTDINVADRDPQFNPQPGAVNRLVVVGQGQEFAIFSNGVKLRSVNGRAGFDEGFVAFIAINQGGGITCQFDNAWLWKLN